MLRTGISLLNLLILATTLSSQDIIIKDGWYQSNGEKFFIKGIGYEPHTRPGQTPWEYCFDPALLQSDMQRIKEAGFNTIRTWDALSEEELQIVAALGLKILFGIWIDSHGNYSDPDFIENTLTYLRSILAYSKNYSAIIAYLIMNEPLVEDIQRGGASNLLNLWQQAIALIQQNHPAAPVTIANTAIGDFLRTDLFQIGAYNLYIYNPVLISSSHGYAGYCEFLKNNRAENMPLIVTEFGLSVSPGQPSMSYGYGGNSLAQQAEGDLLMYRSLIDGGAQGGCVFQYHDGWWKSGNPAVHDNNPEEWFGLFEFDSEPGNPAGTPRPAWSALTNYNQAIVYQPKNQQVYTNSIPVELFLTDAIDSMTLLENDSVWFTAGSLPSYVSTAITPPVGDSLTDLNLHFRFFDKYKTLVKEESISCLFARQAIQLPALDLTVLPTNINTANTIHLIVKLHVKPPFSLQNKRLDYAYFPHQGFQPGECRSTNINLQNGDWQFTDQFSVSPETQVVTCGAGATVPYGTFSKRLYSQKIILRGDWANAIASPDLLSNKIDPNSSINSRWQTLSGYPNPFNSLVTIVFKIPEQSDVTIAVFNLQGQKITDIVQDNLPAGQHKVTWDAHRFPKWHLSFKNANGNGDHNQKTDSIKVKDFSALSL